MPAYDYHCDHCNLDEERCPEIAKRDEQTCNRCGDPLRRMLSAPLFKFHGRVTKGGGMDRFTADMLGVPLKELPPGLRTPEKPE